MIARQRAPRARKSAERTSIDHAAEIIYHEAQRVVRLAERPISGDELITIMCALLSFQAPDDISLDPDFRVSIRIAICHCMLRDADERSRVEFLQAIRNQCDEFRQTLQ